MKSLKEALVHKHMDGLHSNQKYVLTDETFNWGRHTLYRIESLKNISSKKVKKGDLGGWIESYDNLSQKGDCWVADDAKVLGKAYVYDNALIAGDAVVYGVTESSNNAQVYGNARVYDYAWVYDNAQVYGDAEVYDNAKVCGNAEVFGKAEVHGDAKIPTGKINEGIIL